MALPSESQFGDRASEGLDPIKKKKKPEVDLGVTTPSEVRYSDLNTRVSSAERGAASTLPTDIIYGVALSAGDDKEAARAATAIARTADVSVAAQELVRMARPGKFGPSTQAFIDPLTGQPITLQRARQFARVSLAANLARTLGQEPKPPTEGAIAAARARREPPQKRIVWDPAQVQQYFDIIDAASPGNLDAQIGVTYAMTAARREVPIDKFKMNLDFIAGWNNGTQKMTEAEVVDLALRWSNRMDRPITGRDIAGVQNPAVAELIAQQQGAGGPVDVGGMTAALGGTVPQDVKNFNRVLNENPDAFATGRDWEEALPVATAMLAFQAGNANGFWEKKVWGVIDPILSPVGRWIHGRYEDIEPLREDLIEPLWNGVTDVSNTGIAEIYGALHGAGVIATGGIFEKGGVSGGLQASWAYTTQQRNFGNDFALATGAEPGTLDFTVRSAGFQFLAGWFMDPLVLLGWAAKARGLQRLIGAAGTDLSKGTGIFASYTNPGIPYSELLDQALRTQVPGRWEQAAVGTGKALGKSGWDLTDWLIREKNLDHMVDTPRGLYGLGPGLDRTTATFIRTYVDDIRRGVIDNETRNGVQDLMRVASGLPSRTKAGAWMARAIDENLIAKVDKQIDDVVRGVLEGEPINFGASGRIATTQRKAFRTSIIRQLTGDVGLSTKRAEEIADRATNMRAGDFGVPPIRTIEAVQARIPRVAEGIIGPEGPTFTSPDEVATIAAEVNPNAMTWRDAVYGVLPGRQRTVPTVGSGLDGWYPTQILRDTRLAIRESPIWRNRIAERVMHPFFDRAPPVAINLEEGNIAQEGYRAYLNAWGVFDESDMARLTQAFVDAQMVPRAGRELIWRNAVDAATKEAFEKMGLPEELIPLLTAQARPRYAFFHEAINRAYSFQPVEGSNMIARSSSPALETQMLNSLTLPNPLEIRRAIHDAFKTVPEMEAKAQKLFGHGLDALTGEEQKGLLEAIRFDRQIKIAFKNRAGGLAETLTRGLKKMFVVRPAWTVRVVLMDENFRAQVHLSSLVERWMGISKRGVTRKFTVAGSDIELVVTPNLPVEASVSNTLSSAKAYTTIAEQEKGLVARLGVGELKPGMDTYWPEYENIMNQQIAQDPLGQRILKALTGDMHDGQAVTMDDALQWALANPRRWVLADAAKMDVADHFNQTRNWITYMTGGSEEVARQTLARNFERTLARANIPEERLPHVAGSLAGEVLGAQASLGNRAMGRAFSLFGSRPSAWLNRNPLYRNTYAREVDRLLNVAAREGRVFTPEELRVIKEGLENGPTVATMERTGQAPALLANAHEHAVRETQRIMFTMADRSQFAEAHNLLIPFMGPFEEQFKVWAQLAWENPRIVPRAFQIGRLAVDTGFIKKNEQGEWTLPAATYAPFAVLGDWLGGFSGTDFLPSVAGLNTFWGNAFNFPLPGGGHIPLPAPGFNWGVETFMKSVVPDSWKNSEGWRGSIYAYTFAYGDRFSMIPNNYQRIFWAVAPVESDVLQATYEDVIRGAALQGIPIARDQDNPKEGELTEAQAMRMARAWLGYRGLVGTIFPTYPMVTFEHDDARTDYFRWADQFGFDRADEMWKSKFGEGNDSELALISTRVWARNGTAIPTTEGVSELLADPEFQRVLNQMPELAFYLIPPEVRNGEVDLEVYNEQVAAGLRVLRPTGDETTIVGSGRNTFSMNSSIVQLDINQGWEQFFNEDARFRAQVDGAFPKGTPYDVSDTGWTKYQNLLADHNAIVADIQEEHPLWAARESGQIQIDDPYYAGNVQMLKRVINNSPEFRKTAFGQSMTEYFQATEGEGGILERMKNANVRNLDTVAARKLGIAGDYKDLVAGLKEKYGDDFTRPFGIFLEGRHLTDVVTGGMERTMALNPDYLNVYNDWKERWDATSPLIGGATGDARLQDEGTGYLIRQELSLEADAIADQFGDPKLNPQYIWFHNELNKFEQREVRLSTAIKPYVFLTAFERREILGIDTSDDVEAAWARIAKDRLETERAIGRNPQNKDQYWDAHNRFVEGIVSHVPGFDKEAQRNRNWTFALEAGMPKTWKAGPEGDAWKNLFQFSHDLRGAFNQAEFVDDEEFARIQNIMFDYITELKQWSPDFKAHFNLLEETSYGPGLIDTFLDPYWYLDF